MAEKEYIERGALIAEIDKNEPSNWTDTEAEIQSILDYRLYKGIAISQPAADVTEVRHGEWKIKTDDYDCEYMMCSCCKEEFYPVDEDTVDATPNYCPNCGAKMDGERKEQK